MESNQFNAAVLFALGLGTFGLLAWFIAAEGAPNKRVAGTLFGALLIGLGAYAAAFLKFEKGTVFHTGVSFLAQILPAEGRTVTRNEAERAKEVVVQRLEALGKTDFRATLKEDNQIFVEVAGVEPKELEADRALIERAAKLEFRLVHPDSERLIAERGEAVWDAAKGKFAGVLEPGWEEIPSHEGAKGAFSSAADEKSRLEAYYKARQTIIVKREPELSGKSVKQAWASTHPGAPNLQLHVNLHKEHGEKMEEIAKAHLRERLAIVVDHEAISAPTIQGVFGDRFEITGFFSQRDAVELAGQLMNPLENPLRIGSVLPVNLPGTGGGNPHLKRWLLAGGLFLLGAFVLVVTWIRKGRTGAGFAASLLLLMAPEGARISHLPTGDSLAHPDSGVEECNA